MTDLTRRTLFGLTGLGFVGASGRAAEAGTIPAGSPGAPTGALLRAADFGAIGDGVADELPSNLDRSARPVTCGAI